MHGSRWRREETRPVGNSRAAQAPPADPTSYLASISDIEQPRETAVVE